MRNKLHYIVCAAEEVIDTRTIILNSIDKVPGIRYRELLRLTGLTYGSLQYNLRILEKTQKIKVDRQYGKRARYYPRYLLSSEACILGHIRNISSRQIVLFLLEHDLCTFGQILEQIKKAPSTLSWHLTKLYKAGIIAVRRRYKLRLYTIVNSELVSHVLCRYRKSLIVSY